MDLKEKKLLVFSIFIVFLSSWFIGNLMNLRVVGGEEFVFFPEGFENIAFISSIVFILIPISYISYISYRSKKESEFILNNLIILGFWIFVFFSGLVLIIFGIWPFTLLLRFLPNVPFGLDIDLSIGPFYLNIGLILLILLIGMFFSIYIYLKVHESRIKTKNRDLGLSDIEKNIYSKEKTKQETIEDSLSSTLNKAITEIDEGGDIRNTVINSYYEMTKLLEEKGAENEESMTPREFKEEITKKIPSTKNFVSNITFLFEEARYSPHELREKDRNEVIDQLEELKEELK